MDYLYTHTLFRVRILDVHFSKRMPLSKTLDRAEEMMVWRRIRKLSIGIWMVEREMCVEGVRRLVGLLEGGRLLRRLLVDFNTVRGEKMPGWFDEVVGVVGVMRGKAEVAVRVGVDG